MKIYRHTAGLNSHGWNKLIPTLSATEFTTLRFEIIAINVNVKRTRFQWSRLTDFDYMLTYLFVVLNGIITLCDERLSGLNLSSKIQLK